MLGLFEKLSVSARLLEGLAGRSWKGFHPIVALAVIALGCGVASANDIYIAQSAAGTGSGQDCADAKALSFFNTSGNWGTGASQIGPGTTVHLCGTVTVAAGAQALIAQGNGANSNPITIKFEPNAIIQAPYLSSGGAINLSSHSFITVDGGINGLIQNTLNGSPGASCLAGPCSNQQYSVAIMATPCSNCEIKNLTFANLYIHTQCEASSGCDNGLNGADGVNAIRFGGSNFLSHDNTFHDVGWSMLEMSGNDSNVQIYNNQFYNMDHGIACGASSGTVVSSLFIYNNHFHDMANWDTGVADSYHHDGIHCFSTLNSSKIQNLYIYNNQFDGNEGRCCVTAWIFLEGGTSGGQTPWTDSTGTAFIWNNVFVGTLDLGNGQVYIGAGTAHLIYNNTFLVAGSSGGSCLVAGRNGTSGTTYTIENNLFSGCNTMVNVDSTVTTARIDYNAYANSTGGGNPSFNWLGKSSTNSFSTWQASCACDLHSLANLSGTLGVASNGTIQAGSMAIGSGLNLAVSCSGNLASLCSSINGVPRLASWDGGAYGYSGTTSPLVPPTALAAIIN
jgi:hypothetical protein